MLAGLAFEEFFRNASFFYSPDLDKIPGEQRAQLQCFAQTHVIGQNAIEAESVEEGEPCDSW
jgi:hypothetical protein